MYPLFIVFYGLKTASVELVTGWTIYRKKPKPSGREGTRTPTPDPTGFKLGRSVRIDHGVPK